MASKVSISCVAGASALLLAACGGSGGAGTGTSNGGVTATGDGGSTNTDVPLADAGPGGDPSEGTTAPGSNEPGMSESADPIDPGTPEPVEPETPGPVESEGPEASDPVEADPAEPGSSDPAESETPGPGTPTSGSEPDPVADGDGDGMSDADELTCGSDPGDAASVSTDGDMDGRPDCLRGYPVLPVTGERGETVACEETLPCTWVSADGAIEVQLIFADGHSRINSNRGVGTYLATTSIVTSSRDARVTFLGGSEAASESGAAFTGESRESPPMRSGFNINVTTGPLELNLLAGDPIRIREHFNEFVTEESSLTELSLLLADGDTRITAGFSDVPLGRAPSVDKDCENVLPCTWISADGEQQVTVDRSRINFDEEVEVDFSVVTSREAQALVLHSNNSVATGNDLSTYDFVRLVFGEASDVVLALSATPAGVVVPGTITTQFRTVRLLDTLQSFTRLRIQLFDGSESLPYLDPVFRNVPVAR